MKDFLLSLCVIAAVCAIYTWSSVTHIADSKYSLLLTTSLIQDQTFDLKKYFSGGDKRDLPYQIRHINNKYLYVYPPGPPLMAVPVVLVGNALGKKIVNDDGTYNLDNELWVQKRAAAFIVCLFLLSVFFSARVFLGPYASALVVLAIGLGTTAFSSLSRGLWSDTWGVMLMGWSIYLFLRMEIRKQRTSIVLFTTLLAWAFFCKPVYAVGISAIFFYFLIYRLKDVPVMALTGAFWFLLFVLYALDTFGTYVPYYYYLGLLRTNSIWSVDFWEALAGHLVSPSRGLLVFSPWLLLVGLGLIRHRATVPAGWIALMALLVILVEIVFLSRWRMWWGGHSFGPRLLSGALPWISLLSILALAGWKESLKASAAAGRQFPKCGTAVAALIGTVLLGASIFIHGRGAVSWDTQMWNVHHRTEATAEKVWNWSCPQWMEGLIDSTESLP